MSLEPEQKSDEQIGTAFITGGSGYIGRNMIRYLIHKGWKVNALARSPNSCKIVESLGATSISGDLSNKSIKAMTEGMKDCIVCFHCAAFVDTWGKLETAMSINRDGTLNVIAACRESKTIKKFIHVSTEQVLCIKSKPMINVDETTPYPNNGTFGIYGSTKREAEISAIKSNIGPNKFEVIVIRPRLVYGRDDTTILPNIIQKCKLGLFKWIDGGEYLTSTVHIDNVIKAMYLGYTKGKGGEIYFITDGDNVRWIDFWSDLLNCVGITPPEKDKTMSYGFISGVAGILEWLYCCCKGYNECKCCGFVLNEYLHPPVTQNEIEVAGKQCTVKDDKIRKELGFTNAITRKEALMELAKDHNIDFDKIKHLLVTI